MRILIGIAFLTSLSPSSTHGFVPSLRDQRSAVSSLNARFTPRAQPPLPPPPPEKSPDVFDSLLQKITTGEGSTDTNGGSNFVDDLLRELSLRLENGVTLPSLPNKFPPFSLNGLEDLRQQFQELDRSVVSRVEQLASQVQDGLITDYPNLTPYFDRLQTILAPALQSPSLTLLVSALLTYTVVSSILSWDRGPPPSQPYPAGKYDPIAARAYFDNKVYMVVSRGLEILVQSLQFGMRLLQDKLNDNVQETEFQRGKELARLLTRLGPTFIKGAFHRFTTSDTHKQNTDMNSLCLVLLAQWVNRFRFALTCCPRDTSGDWKPFKTRSLLLKRQWPKKSWKSNGDDPWKPSWKECRPNLSPPLLWDKSIKQN